ncbi:STAS domain-containing protein [Kitasatospora sp. NPDC059146]|uniref:STAS domain-containing protein n=1 Tax=unclassified Kitasatospora TaxID=2633591 RepID=UPI0036C0BCF4
MTENDEVVVHGAHWPGHRLVAAEGELEWESAQAFAEQVDRAVEGFSGLLVADLSRVEFADSSALHTLFEAHRSLAAGGGRLVIAGPLDPLVRRLFEVSSTTGYFAFAETVAEAVGGPEPTEPRAGGAG